MKTKFFANCKSLDEVKKMYKELAMLHHPDRGGDTLTMQLINAEYASIRSNPQFEFSSQSTQDQAEFIKYPEILSMIIGLPGIMIELVGNWLWVSGNTFPLKADLKKAGFFFAPKKVMWYYRPADYASMNRKPKSMDYIRSKYGSDLIESKRQEPNVLK